MATVETLHLPKETQLTIVPDSNASGHLVRIYSGSQPTDFTAISAEDNIVLGPFNDERDYRVTLVGGTFSYSTSFEGITPQDYVENDEPEANVAEVTDTATGAELETAINGILAILVAKGLMDPEV